MNIFCSYICTYFTLDIKTGQNVFRANRGGSRLTFSQRKILTINRIILLKNKQQRLTEVV